MSTHARGADALRITRRWLAIGALLAPLAAGADVRYDYVGGPLTTYIPDLFAPTDRVAAFFTLATPAHSGNYAASDFADYGFSIGGLTFMRAASADAGAHIEVAPDGALTSWSFVIGNYPAPHDEGALVELWANSADLVPVGDRVQAYYQGTTRLAAYAATPGSWTFSTVPEPATALLLLAGLAAVGAPQRRTL